MLWDMRRARFPLLEARGKPWSKTGLGEEEQEPSPQLNAAGFIENREGRKLQATTLFFSNQSSN